MRKLLVICVCALLAVLCMTVFAAYGEETAPTAWGTEEADTCVAEVLARCIAQNSVPDESGTVYCLGEDGETVTLEEGASLAEDARVRGIVFGEAADPRGIYAGDPVYRVLRAYRNENEALSGTRATAMLYMEGDLNQSGCVSAGYLDRDGQRVNSISYAVFADLGDRVRLRRIVYTLDGEIVTQIALLDEDLDREEALRLLEDITESLEFADYKPVFSSDNGMLPEILQREDLTFGGIDFLDITPELTEAVWGAPQADEWLEDGEGFLRVCEWEALRIVYVYDAEKQLKYTSVYNITGDGPEGPRGLRLGDPLESVLHRFRFEAEAGILYGDGENAPYGELSAVDNSTTVKYTVSVDERQIVLNIDLLNDKVIDILISMN